MKLSKKSQYGLRAMVQLAKKFKKKEILSLKKISEQEDISFDFLEKIISELDKAGLVKAKKGVQGGYFLAKPPKNISISQILRVLEKDIELVKCENCGRIKKCVAKNVWAKIQLNLEKTLNSMSLASLIK